MRRDRLQIPFHTSMSLPVVGVHAIQSLVETKPIVGITPPPASLGLVTLSRPVHIVPPLPSSTGPGLVILYEPIHTNGDGIVWRFLLPMQNAGLISLTIVEDCATGRFRDLSASIS